MVEELLETYCYILAVTAFAQVMCLSVILEHPDRLSEASQSHEHLYTLIPRYRSVLVIMHDQQRRLDAVGVENRGVGDIEFRRLPKVASDSALAHLILGLTGITR